MNKKAFIEHYQSSAAVIRWISLVDICFFKENIFNLVDMLNLEKKS